VEIAVAAIVEVEAALVVVEEVVAREEAEEERVAREGEEMEKEMATEEGEAEEQEEAVEVVEEEVEVVGEEGLALPRRIPSRARGRSLTGNNIIVSNHSFLGLSSRPLPRLNPLLFCLNLRSINFLLPIA